MSVAWMGEREGGDGGAPREKEKKRGRKEGRDDEKILNRGVRERERNTEKKREIERERKIRTSRQTKNINEKTKTKFIGIERRQEKKEKTMYIFTIDK